MRRSGRTICHQAARNQRLSICGTTGQTCSRAAHPISKKQALGSSYDFSRWITHTRDEHCHRVCRVWLDFSHSHQLAIPNESGNAAVSVADSESNTDTDTNSYTNTNCHSG